MPAIALVRACLAAPVALSLLSAFPVQAADLAVSVFISPIGEVLKKDVLEPYRKQSGIDLRIDNRDWGLGSVRAKVEAGGADWDIVTNEETEVLQGCDEGVFAEIDKSRLPGLADFDKIGEGYKCGVPFIFYSSVLAYDKKKLRDLPSRWADLWDRSKWPGRRAMRKSPVQTLEVALMADGVPRNDVYKVLATKAGVDRAFRKLDEIKPDVVWWVNAGQSRQMLASGEVVMGMSYDNGIAFFNKTQGTDFGLSRQDAILLTDFWSIVRGSKHVDSAYTFLNHASQPQVQSAITNGLAISTPNRKAIDFVNPDWKPFLTPNPDALQDAIPLDAEFWVNNTDELTRRFDAWLAGR
jgi:putative spermidine/putrescine transport system substrate-binding protein